MQLYDIIFTLISLKRERSYREKGTKKRKRKKERQKVEGNREKLYLFNEYVSK
jgi:hypothetical protein